MYYKTDKIGEGGVLLLRVCGTWVTRASFCVFARALQRGVWVISERGVYVTPCKAAPDARAALQLNREIIEMPKPKQKQAPVLCNSPLPVPVLNSTRLSHILFPIRHRGSQVTVTDSGLTECVEFGSLGPSAFVFVWPLGRLKIAESHLNIINTLESTTQRSTVVTT